MTLYAIVVYKMGLLFRHDKNYLLSHTHTGISHYHIHTSSVTLHYSYQLLHPHLYCMASSSSESGKI